MIYPSILEKGRRAARGICEQLGTARVSRAARYATNNMSLTGLRKGQL